jgi:hypothetical protein
VKNESKKMALAKCSECGVNIIREAKFCPKCGAPAPEPSTDEKPVSAHADHKNEKQSPPPPKRAVAVPPPRMTRPAPPKLPPKVEKTIGAENRSSTSKAFWLLLAAIVSIALAAGVFWQRDLIFGGTDPEIIEASIVEQSNSISSPPETQTEVTSQLPTAAQNPTEQAAFPEQPAYDRSIDSASVQPQEGYPKANAQQTRSDGYSSQQREPEITDRTSSQSKPYIINVYHTFIADTAEDNREIGRSIARLAACGVMAQGNYTYELKITGDHYLVYSGPYNDPMHALRERQLASSCGIKSRPQSLRR